MNLLRKQQPVPPTIVSRTVLKSMAVVLISLLSMLVVISLTGRSLAAYNTISSDVPQATNHAFAGLHPSGPMTQQIYLPLAMNNIPIDSAFGVQMYGSLSLSNGLAYVVKSNAGWVRLPVYWTLLEPVNTTPDKYNWADLDATVQAAASAGVQAIFTIEGNPTWAAAKPGGPVTNTADLQEFVGALVARYPYIRYWEIYNEPDRSDRFGHMGNVYAALLKSIYPVIKSANPSANVVLGGLALDWFEDQGGPFDRNFLRDVLVNCSGTCFDVANFHYYPFFRAGWELYGHDIIGKANYVRQFLATYQFNRPIFATETGWPTSSSWGSEELSARYVPKSFARGLAAGLSTTIWYAMFDSDTSNPGLLDSTTVPGTLIPRSAYTAYQVLTALMNGAQYVGAAPASAPIEGYQFLVRGKRLDIYWYECPGMVPASGEPQDCSNMAPVRISASRVATIDKLGNQLTINDADDGVQDGVVTFNVGSSPIYVDYSP